MKCRWILVVVALMLFATVAPAWAAGSRALTDSELDQVTAGGFNVQLLEGGMNFSFDSGTKFANKVSGSGTLEYSTTSLPSGCIARTCSISNLNMATGAQANLSSLVNIVAVNSLIDVLLNLNINVAAAGAKQTIGTISQGNLLK